GALLQFTGQTISALVLYQSGNLVLAGSLSVGTALTLQLLAQNAAQPLSSFGSLYIALQRTKVSWTRLSEPFHVPVLPVEAATPERYDDPAGEVVFDGVSFSYPHTGQQILHELAFRLAPGASVAL